jgi:hypothetical protein
LSRSIKIFMATELLTWSMRACKAAPRDSKGELELPEKPSLFGA